MARPYSSCSRPESLVLPFRLPLQADLVQLDHIEQPTLLAITSSASSNAAYIHEVDFAAAVEKCLSLESSDCR